MASWVVLATVVAVTAAGILHQRSPNRRLTLALLVAVVVVGGVASVVVATMRATACPCN
jgi:hypothetical protein